MLSAWLDLAAGGGEEGPVFVPAFVMVRFRASRQRPGTIDPLERIVFLAVSEPHRPDNFADGTARLRGLQEMRKEIFPGAP